MRTEVLANDHVSSGFSKIFILIQNRLHPPAGGSGKKHRTPQGFTGLSEGLSPEELTTRLNEFLSAMTDIIQEQGGTIDKYEGDAIIAFWNAPVDQADHAVRSVRSALRCQEKLAQMRPGFRERVGKELFMRVGINSGPAVVGNMGSRTRFDYTMLGDAVNLAARLEGINKQFRTYTMISASTLTRS